MTIRQIIDAITYVFRWWFIVLPWEQAIRVRLGRRIKRFEAGWHSQIPFVDKTFVQNTRRRLLIIQEQTLSTSDGKSVTLAGAVGYRIEDVLKLHQSVHHGEETIHLFVNRLVTQFVIGHTLAECTVEALTNAVISKLDLTPFGLNGQMYRYRGSASDELNTNLAVGDSVSK